jgi:hypothetical protein
VAALFISPYAGKRTCAASKRAFACGEPGFLPSSGYGYGKNVIRFLTGETVSGTVFETGLMPG